MPSTFFAFLDDLAAVMDDVAVMTKVAGKKTAGLLGDDLAVNAEKAIGFEASRELPVLWSITKGSFINKVDDVYATKVLLDVKYPSLGHPGRMCKQCIIEAAMRYYEHGFPIVHCS